MRDPSGDATENPLVGGDLTRLPVSSVPAADAIEILTSHDRAAARLSITMRVTGEPRPDSHSPSGYLYATRFFIGAHELVAMAVTTPDGEQFDVGRLDGTLNPPEQLDGEAVSGAFSLPQRTARVDIPLSVLTQLAGLDGRRATLSGFRAQTYRALGTAATGTTLVLTDDSSGGRSYSVPRAACF